MTLWHRGARLPLGTKRFLFFGRRTLYVTSQQAQAHMHVLGKTGSGKSYFLAGLFLARKYDLPEPDLVHDTVQLINGLI